MTQPVRTDPTLRPLYRGRFRIGPEDSPPGQGAVPTFQCRELLHAKSRKRRACKPMIGRFACFSLEGVGVVHEGQHGRPLLPPRVSRLIGSDLHFNRPASILNFTRLTHKSRQATQIFYTHRLQVSMPDYNLSRWISQVDIISRLLCSVSMGSD